MFTVIWGHTGTYLRLIWEVGVARKNLELKGEPRRDTKWDYPCKHDLPVVWEHRDRARAS